MLIITLTATMLLSANVTSSQEYQPFPTKCAKWEVYRCFYFYQPGWHDKYTVTLDGSDTTYAGIVYKKLYITQHHLPGTIYDSLHAPVFFGGMREVNKKIYIFQIWASVDTMPQLVYDFTSTNLGDTIYTKALAGSMTFYPHKVVGIDSVLVGNKYHKRLDLVDPANSFNQEYWIEGIGSSWGLPWATFWSITDNSYDLSCYNTLGKVVYENPSPTFGMCAGTLPVITCDSSSECDTMNLCKLIMLVSQKTNQLTSAQDSARYQWLNCVTMQPLIGDTNKSFTATSNGSYAVIVQKDECIDTSACFEVTGMGISIQKTENFRIYPVPSTDKVFVDLNREEKVVRVEITSVQGQAIERFSFKKTKVLEINLPSTKGLYLLKVITERGSSVHRVIRE